MGSPRETIRGAGRCLLSSQGFFTVKIFYSQILRHILSNLWKIKGNYKSRSIRFAKNRRYEQSWGGAVEDVAGVSSAKCKSFQIFLHKKKKIPSQSSYMNLSLGKLLPSIK